MAAQRTQKAAALELRRFWQTQILENSRRHIQQACGLVDAGGKGIGLGGPAEKSGYVQRALINEIAVSALAVIAEALAVVGDKYDERFGEQLGLLEEIPELS